MTTTPAADAAEDDGLAGHLAAIGRLHAEALVLLESLAHPWRTLLPRPAEAPATGELAVSAQPPVPAVRHAA